MNKSMKDYTQNGEISGGEDQHHPCHDFCDEKIKRVKDKKMDHLHLTPTWISSQETKTVEGLTKPVTGYGYAHNHNTTPQQTQSCVFQHETAVEDQEDSNSQSHLRRRKICDEHEQQSHHQYHTDSEGSIYHSQREQTYSTQPITSNSHATDTVDQSLHRQPDNIGIINLETEPSSNYSDSSDYAYQLYRKGIDCGQSGDDQHNTPKPGCSANLHRDDQANGDALPNHEQFNGRLNPPNNESKNFQPAEREGFTSYLWSELSRGYVPDENEEAYNVKKERVYAFLRIPKECEQFMLYGFLQCVDSFLFIFTFLPLRLVIVLLKCLAKPWTLLSPQWYLSSSQKCDVVKGIIIALGCFLMTQVDASMVYHIIRGQDIIKLYIFFNLLEVGDRLLSSFGQDILDALMWTIADSRNQRYITIFSHIITGVIYVFVHSMLVLLQASALNVAFNSQYKALLTILISNNAVELKGSVFKKFEKTNLFQMACSDVRERFHLQVLIFIVCIRNMTDFNWDIAKFWELVPDITVLLLSEVFVDNTKHAFITKFNNIPSKVYREYTALLANDVITSRKKSAFSDVSDQVSRRLGLIPLPLACLVIKIIYQSVKIQTPVALLNAIVAYLCLLTAKMIIGVVVYGWAVDYYNGFHQEHDREQAKKGRKRHKSGIDADLLKCENNFHWNKKPIPPSPFIEVNGAKEGNQSVSTETLRAG